MSAGTGGSLPTGVTERRSGSWERSKGRSAVCSLVQTSVSYAYVSRKWFKSWCVCVFFVRVPQQLRMDLFRSGLNGNTEPSESAFPLWGPSVATA